MLSRRTVPVAVLLAVGLALSGCAGAAKTPGEQVAADKLAAALQQGDLSRLPLTGASAATAKVLDPLKGFATKVSVAKVTRSGTHAAVTLDWVQSRDRITWKHTTHADLTEVNSVWTVQWANSIVADGLGQDASLRVSTITAARGRILGAGGTPIVEPRPVMRFGIDKEQVVGGAPAAAASARRLAVLLGVTPGPFVKLVKAAGPRAFVEAIVLRRPDATQRILNAVAAITGARGIAGTLPLAPSKGFAAALLGTVGPATDEAIKKSAGRLRAGDDTGLSGLQQRYDAQLAGTRGLRISAVPATDPAGAAAVLFEVAPVAGKDLTTTLDLRLEQKAQDLLASTGPASALVAIRPSTGQLLAVASGPGSAGYNTATFGQYAPGSTFKVISALALLRAGLTPASPVTCPAEVTVNGKPFKNYADYPAGKFGRISLRDAVANSCNTAFIGQRAKITGTALADAAASLGFGKDYDVGFPAYFGQVPTAASETEAAADLIGQGKVLASPLAMALVAAAVAHGKAIIPTLVSGTAPQASAAPPRPLSTTEAAQLRELMHAVVTDGSGRFLQVLQPPLVYAKTGTAEYGTRKTPGAALLTHAWMIGIRGDLAVAVFVDTGTSGSGTAGPILESFLRAAG